MRKAINRNVVSSPIRWAGSKKKLLNEMLEVFDDGKSIYVEPFLGSGVVLLNVLNNKMYTDYYVNDSNRNLILFYIQLRDNPESLTKKIEQICRKYNSLKSEDERCNYYYEKRKSFNQNRINDLTRASLFWFLMTAGFNGVYRINSKDKFNVPCGKRKKIVANKNNLHKISAVIQNVNFYSMDYKDFFREIYENKRIEDTFIYCDPPYIPETKSSETHVLYTKTGFSHDSFVIEIDRINKLQKSSIMISMSESKKAIQIYSSGYFKKCDINEIVRDVNPTKKIKSKEIAFLNYST